MKKLVISLFLFLMIAVPQYNVFSQQGDLADKLETELARTDEIIERANEIVQTSNSSTARLALEYAIKLQNNSKGEFRMGQGHYKNSLELTIRARVRAQEAINAARHTSQSESVTLRKLEKAEELLDRVNQALTENPDNSVAGVYRSARDNLDKAWELYRSNQMQGSLKLADQVERTLLKLIKMANQLNNDAKNYDHRSEILREALERAAELTNECDSENALRLLEQAREKYLNAESMASETKYQAALKNLQLAREFTSRATSLCQNTEALERRYQHLKEQTDQLAEQIGRGRESANNLLNQIRKQLELTRQNLDENNSESATAAIKAAQLSYDQLKRTLENSNQ